MQLSTKQGAKPAVSRLRVRRGDERCRWADAAEGREHKAHVVLAAPTAAAAAANHTHLAATSKGLRVMLLNSLPMSDVNWRHQPVG